jgi:glycosyltransferase involved in cell wall biosynthesis
MNAAAELSICQYLFFSRGGIARYTDEVLAAMATIAGVRCELACDSGFEPANRGAYSQWAGLMPLAHSVRWRQRMRFLRGQIVNPRRFARHAKENAFDIAHLCDFNHLTYPLWRSQLRRSVRKVVISVHDVRREKALLHRGFEETQLKEIYRDADALLVHSAAQRAELHAFAGVDPNRIHHIPFGLLGYGRASAPCDELRRKFGLPADKQIALVFGNLRDDKNLELFLRAAAPHANDLHVVVAGRAAAHGHQSLEHYQQLCASLGTSSSVTFISRYLADTEVADIFSACDWVATPYAASFTSYSGVVSVAATYRRPILVSDTDTFREALADHRFAILANIESHDSLTNDISEMLRRAPTIAAGDFDSFVSRQSWRENAEQTVAVYRSLLE